MYTPHIYKLYVTLCVCKCEHMYLYNVCWYVHKYSACVHVYVRMYVHVGQTIESYRMTECFQHP